MGGIVWWLAAVSRAIDVMHLGRDRVICSYEVDGVIVDPGPTSCLDALLEGLEGRIPRALLLTHIHLDHAGATGELCRRFPGLEVYVHERGAPHIVDPSKLMASATRLYGERMDELWGRWSRCPRSACRRSKGGETVEGFEVAYTPGHASHHVTYFHEADRRRLHRRRRRRAHPAARARAGADAAAGHRRRAVARLDRDRRRLEPGSACA